MFRLRRTIGWLFLVVVAIFLVSLLGANLYVQSQATQARIQQELSQRLKMPLQIQRISVTPWGGLKLSGITIRQSNNVHDPTFLQARPFQLRVRLGSIFWRPLVIKEVALIAPTVIWPQNESGKWRVPMAERPSEAQTQAEEEPTVSAPENLPEGTPPQKESKKTKPVVVESTPAGPQIKKIRLSDGSFHFLDHEKRNIALFDGVQFSSSMRDVDSIRGQVRIDKIVLRDRVFLSALRSPIRYDPSEIELFGITAQIAKLRHLDLKQAEAKYRLAGTTVLVDELLLRSPNWRLTATGSVSLRGKLALDSVLAINEKIRSQLFRGIRENFVPTSEPGEYALQFNGGGTVDKPKTDLMERAVGPDLKDLGGVIDALSGRGKSKKTQNAV